MKEFNLQPKTFKPIWFLQEQKDYVKGGSLRHIGFIGKHRAIVLGI